MKRIFSIILFVCFFCLQVSHSNEINLIPKTTYSYNPTKEYTSICEIVESINNRTTFKVTVDPLLQDKSPQILIKENDLSVFDILKVIIEHLNTGLWPSRNSIFISNQFLAPDIIVPKEHYLCWVYDYGRQKINNKEYESVKRGIIFYDPDSISDIKITSSNLIIQETSNGFHQFLVNTEHIKNVSLSFQKHHNVTDIIVPITSQKNYVLKDFDLTLSYSPIEIGRRGFIELSELKDNSKRIYFLFKSHSKLKPIKLTSYHLIDSNNKKVQPLQSQINFKTKNITTGSFDIPANSINDLFLVIEIHYGSQIVSDKSLKFETKNSQKYNKSL